jgi:hypothetical protein
MGMTMMNMSYELVALDNPWLDKQTLLYSLAVLLSA